MIYKGKPWFFTSIITPTALKAVHDCRLILLTTRWYPLPHWGSVTRVTMKIYIRLRLERSDDPMETNEETAVTSWKA